MTLLAAPRRLDLTLLLPVAALVTLGLVMVYSSSAVLAADRFHSQTFFLERQAVRLGIGLVLMLALSRVDYHVYQRLGPWLLLASVLLLAVLLATKGGVRGANRWIQVASVTIQPTELARFACVLYLAKLLDRKGERITSFGDGVLPAALVLGALAALILRQPNLGSTIALLLTGIGMLHLAGARHRHIGAIALGAALVAVLIIIANGYMRARVTGWLGHLGTGAGDTQGRGWQLRQSIVALGSGGLTGTGPGKGIQKFFFLPDPHTDFIYAVVGEELGLIGTTAVLAAYLVLVLRGLKIAARAPDRFGYLLAAGLTLNLAVYAGLNIGVATGLLPTTGLPLPFLSYGGSALVTNLGVVGVLLNVARQMETGIRTSPAPGGATRRRPGAR
ncbi:MAG TPA: putative lipid II flippase FtsW [Candidatus Eisenbacteria bacterium]|jgi:cell division protein FtsW